MTKEDGAHVLNVGSKAELESTIADGGPTFVHFWATWCEPSKHMDVVFAQLALDYRHARFLRVEAEEQPDIAEFYGVASVPFFLFIKDGAVIDTLEGANAPELANKIAKFAGAMSWSAETAGGPESFGSSTVFVLETAQQGRQANGKSGEEGGKSVGQVNGAAAENGGLAQPNGAESANKTEAIDEKLKTLINSKSVLLFMKGTPEEPRCGFSKKTVNALNDTGVEFGTFNILSDPEVREELKRYSNWPTYPQLYLNGELLGGCDIILEMGKSGELKQTFLDAGLLPKPSLEERLKQLINSSNTVLFMKGTPEEPKCGFSRKVVTALKDDGIQFDSFNILSDDEVRQGLKTFSNWPTFPQLYHKGELLGGCDIVLEMKASGDLKSTCAG